jgi:DNA-binding beta-propeller fold protein YncE
MAPSGAGSTPLDGSYLYVDNLAFAGTSSGISDGPAKSLVEVFPNPASQFVYVAQTNPSKETIFEINSIDGKLVQTGIISGIKSKIELKDLKSGVYFINLINDGVKTTKRLVIN